MSQPMPLDAALLHCFPHGGLHKSTLLKAIGQGKLKCFRLGRSYMVTENDIKDWMASCRVEKKLVSTSDSARAESHDGLSLTQDANTQQEIAEVIARRLRNTSVKNTCLPGTGLTQAKVIRPKFRSRKS